MATSSVPDQEALRRLEEQGERAVAWLRDHWGREGDKEHRCEICGGDNWEVNAQVSLRMSIDPVPGGATIPFVPISCTTCGNTKFLNSFIAGLETPNTYAPVEDKR